MTDTFTSRPIVRRGERAYRLLRSIAGQYDVTLPAPIENAAAQVVRFAELEAATPATNDDLIETLATDPDASLDGLVAECNRRAAMRLLLANGTARHEADATLARTIGREYDALLDVFRPHLAADLAVLEEQSKRLTEDPLDTRQMVRKRAAVDAFQKVEKVLNRVESVLVSLPPVGVQSGYLRFAESALLVPFIVSLPETVEPVTRSSRMHDNDLASDTGKAARAVVIALLEAWREDRATTILRIARGEYAGCSLSVAADTDALVARADVLVTSGLTVTRTMPRYDGTTAA